MQIGPRIRVGGSVGKFGQNLKTGLGKLAQPVGKAVSFINPLLGGAISTAGDILDTTDGKFDPGKALLNAGTQYLGGKVAGKLGGKLLSPLLSKVGGGPTPGIAGDYDMPDGGDYSDLLDPDQTPVAGLTSAAPITATAERFRPTGMKGTLSRVGGFLGKHKDDILDYGAAAEGIYDKYRRNKMQDEALGLARGDFASRAPLRDMAMQDLMNEQSPDLSEIFATPQNRYRPVSIGSRGRGA